jgi:hypothetical protein
MANLRCADIVRDGEDFVVDATFVAPKFGLSVEAFRTELQQGTIVAICERGEGEDYGKTRLTFRRGILLWRFILDRDGAVHEDPLLAKRASSSRPQSSP